MREVWGMYGDTNSNWWSEMKSRMRNANGKWRMVMGIGHWGLVLDIQDMKLAMGCMGMKTESISGISRYWLRYCSMGIRVVEWWKGSMLATLRMVDCVCVCHRVKRLDCGLFWDLVLLLDTERPMMPN